MKVTLSFDVYGTLFDIYSANEKIDKIVGALKTAFLTHGMLNQT